MSLYVVTVRQEFDIVVNAEDGVEARDVALRYADDAAADAGEQWDAGTGRVVEKDSDVAPEWLDSLPYGEQVYAGPDDEHELTVRQILARAEEVAEVKDVWTIPMFPEEPK